MVNAPPGCLFGMSLVQIHKVLLVDDDPDIRMVGELALADVGGLDTVVVASGVEAIEVAATHRPDVILLDVMMPGMDGPETLERLRAVEQLAKIPVIFCTAKSQEHELAALRALRVAGVIRKPFDPMGLAAQVRSIIVAVSPT